MFVTHGISYLRYVDIVVVMKDGVISEIGNYEQLIEQQGAFAEFLANYFNEALEYSSAEEEGKTTLLFVINFIFSSLLRVCFLIFIPFGEKNSLYLL